MSALRAEAINIVENLPEESLQSVIELLRNFGESARKKVFTEDPFWSEENQRHLREAIKELDEGRGQEHDLIEVSD